MENIDNKYTLIQETDWGKYIAHSENCYGEQQTMKQHSEGVADFFVLSLSQRRFLADDGAQ